MGREETRTSFVKSLLMCFRYVTDKLIKFS